MKKLEISILTKMIILILIIWITMGILIYFGLDTWEDRGAFGDLFGAVNSLFSGLAFAGLIYTIFLQKQELTIQRKEIAENRAQLKKSATAQQRSEKAGQGSKKGAGKCAGSRWGCFLQGVS